MTAASGLPHCAKITPSSRGREAFGRGDPEDLLDCRALQKAQGSLTRLF